MARHIEELERLFRLKETGALTQDEFDVEKAKLLGAQLVAARPAQPTGISPVIRPQSYVFRLLGILVFLTVAGLASFLFWKFWPKAPIEQPSRLAANRITSRPPPVTADKKTIPLASLDKVLKFRDSAHCEMSDQTLKLFKRLVVIEHENWTASQGEPLSIAGFEAKITPTFSRNREAEPGQDVTEVTAALPLPGTWHGLRVSRIYYQFLERSSYETMQIRFLESPTRVRSRLNELGYKLPPIGTLREIGGEDEIIKVGIGIETIPGGAALTCTTSINY